MEGGLSGRCYSKIILHACKYPSQPVLGLLLGFDRNGSKEGANWEIIDSVALFHSNPLAPMLEAALLQVEAHVKCLNRDVSLHSQDIVGEGAGKVAIVGCYFANQRHNDRNLHHIVAKLANKIAENVKNPIVFMVENKNLDFANKELTFVKTLVQTKDRKNFAESEQDGMYKVSPSINSFVYDQLIQGKELEIADFEMHLEEPSADWTNYCVETV